VANGDHFKMRSISHVWDGNRNLGWWFGVCVICLRFPAAFTAAFTSSLLSCPFMFDAVWLIFRGVAFEISFSNPHNISTLLGCCL